ncbi:MAG TPA: hypothetical protein VEN81_07830 [Planctomycetota bacterium]|nr:hypothetical protein [Planctomycetota bacterium]
MPTRRRFLPCPQCGFEHLNFRDPALREDGRLFTPWSCPRCRWWGELFEDRTLTQHPPEPSPPAPRRPDGKAPR